jgi:2-amino-4-hydroxy-6-hydroxymethyldihydropteridine diphosphokinase
MAVPPSASTVHKAIVAYVALGANLGDAKATLSHAVHALAELTRTQLLDTSPIYQTEAVDSEGPDYLNSVAKLSTELSPHELLAALQAIETTYGRERPYRNAPRTLDLDLLLYGGEHIATADLTVPHPRMHERAFVLAPLADIAPDVVVPGHGDVRTLLAAVHGQRIRRLNP